MACPPLHAGPLPPSLTSLHTVPTVVSSYACPGQVWFLFSLFCRVVPLFYTAVPLPPPTLPAFAWFESSSPAVSAKRLFLPQDFLEPQPKLGVLPVFSKCPLLPCNWNSHAEATLCSCRSKSGP